ncbi:hypothetical protein [Pararhizobium antarcticum]|nr:hypothetical protein [Pararhizobium antarcticum]
MRHWIAGMLCTLALLLSGIAHHPLAGTMPADMAGYVLPDGSLPDLCLTGDPGDGAAADHVPSGNHHRGGEDCGPCCLSVVATLPLPVMASAYRCTPRPSGTGAPIYHSILPPVLEPGLGARAPPFSGYAAA